MRPLEVTWIEFQRNPPRLAVGLLPFLAGISVWLAADEPKRVMILDSFGRDFAPWSCRTAVLKTELTGQLRVPIEIHEISVEAPRFGETAVRLSLSGTGRT